MAISDACTGPNFPLRRDGTSKNCRMTSTFFIFFTGEKEGRKGKEAGGGSAAVSLNWRNEKKKRGRKTFPFYSFLHDGGRRRKE